VALLLKNGANVDALSKYSDDNSTTAPSASALQWAARGGHNECVQILLNNGTNINHQAENEWTALHEAADEGKYEVVKVSQFGLETIW
jgi:ankyrin repeat protein